MEKEKVRSLQKMPSRNKLAYCKILTLMVNVEEPINQLKMAELYRLMSNIRVATNTRKAAIDFLLEPNQQLDDLCRELVEEVNQQENNILRFSLVKDLLILMGADYIEVSKEKDLLKKVEEKLGISREQKSFLVEEYQSDLKFDEKNSKITVGEIKEETITKAIALGIPLSLVGFSGIHKGLDEMGIRSGLEFVGGKKHTKGYSSAVGLGLTILTAFASYHLLKWGLDRSRRKEERLRGYIMEEMELIHERAIKYLEKDIEVYHQEAIADLYSIDMSLHKEKKELLLRALGTLKNTKPKVI